MSIGTMNLLMHWEDTEISSLIKFSEFEDLTVYEMLQSFLSEEVESLYNKYSDKANKRKIFKRNEQVLC